MTNLAASELDYGITVAIGALLEGMGMLSENLMRLSNDEAIAHPEEDFIKLMKDRGLYHNSVCARWEGKI